MVGVKIPVFWGFVLQHFVFYQSIKSSFLFMYRRCICAGFQIYQFYQLTQLKIEIHNYVEIKRLG